MADYIDREKLLKSIPRVKEDKTISLFGAVADMICMVNAVPKEDVSPVVHGRWGMHSDRPDTLICSICDHAFDVWKHDIDRMHYCPNCGSKMDAEEEDQNA